MINQLPLPPDDNSLPFEWKDRIFSIIKFLNNRIFSGDTKYGSFRTPPLKGRPTDRTAGQHAMIYTTGGTTDNRTATPRPMYTDGTDWRKYSDDTIWAG